MLSQADPDSRSPRNGLCFIADKNFVVLGALFAFFVPLSVAVVFAVLCHAEVRMVEKRLYCIGQQISDGGKHRCKTPVDWHSTYDASLLLSAIFVFRTFTCVDNLIAATDHVFVTPPLPDYQPEVDQFETVSDDALSIETSPGNDSPTSTAPDSCSGSPGHSGCVARDRMQSTLTLTSDVDCEVFRLDEVEQRAALTADDIDELVRRLPSEGIRPHKV